MLVSRARLVFLGVPLLRWYLAHAWFFLVFHCYVGISRTLGFFLLFHCHVGITLGFSWCCIVMLVSRTCLVCFGVPLSRCYNAWFFLVFHCYVGISCMLGFFGLPLLCGYLAHAWFFLVFHCYVGLSRALGFFWFPLLCCISRTLGFS